jgi:hypothetical protein
MPANIEDEPTLSGSKQYGLAALEVAAIFLLFFLFAGSLPPDVGESHYLVKVKHYWQPAWCAGDLFLESRDAHAAFYWSFGWVTRFFSLSVTAWIGRVISWLLLAWSWQRLSWAVIPRPLASLLSAGLMLFFLRNFHLAGEWIVGGIEAKCFAYVLVFLALEAMALGRWSGALLFAGAAGAFHVLVGGWTVVAIGLAWLVSSRDRPRLLVLLRAAAGGFILALPGIVPALVLNWGVDKETTREAARIYVFERLSHHLVYHLFQPLYIYRFQTLVIGWLGLAWLMRGDAALSRVQRVVAGGVIIALAGVAIDQAFVTAANLRGQTALEMQLQAAPLLRYYWFRMSDALVPVGVALSMVLALSKFEARGAVLVAWVQVAAILLAAANIADICYWRGRQRVPPAILQPHPTADSWPKSWFGGTTATQEAANVRAVDWWADWRRVSAWITQNTPADALFLTPRDQQTFKWYAGRPEVANWKDVPQDARGIVEWNQRLDEIYPRGTDHNLHDLAAFSDHELTELAHKYGARYIVIDHTHAARRIGLPRLYPTLVEENPSFEVFWVPKAATP